MIDVKTLKSLAGGFKVLYVEDEPELRDSVGSYLRKIFDHVDTAEDGQIGLKKFQEHSYDIVITDILMPNMNGLEMAAEIKRINEDQEIIVISAYSEPSSFVHAIRLGVNGYIIKPINYEQMNMALNKTINKLANFQDNIMYKEHLEEMVEKRTEALFALEGEKIQNFENTILAFVEMIEERDTYTGGHSQRVAHYSKLIAQKMGRSEEECEMLYRAGILHDIGKVATPDTVLLKPGKLNGLEYKLIQDHVTVSYDLLSKIPMYKELAETIIYHHERYDGKGYPAGVKGNEIPPLARIMIVADAFDAMTTNRIYKGRKDTVGAIEELKSLSGKQFHPEVVESAVEALSDIQTVETINQLPITEIEKERFAYFYRDQVTNAYNTEYLNFILNRNYFEKESLCINVLYLHNFAQFNKKYGWKEGDNCLNEFVNYLYDCYPLSMIFRIHGDDFILTSKSYLEIDMNQFEWLDMFKKDHVTISKLHIDLQEDNVSSLEMLEALIYEHDKYVENIISGID